MAPCASHLCIGGSEGSIPHHPQYCHSTNITGRASPLSSGPQSLLVRRSSKHTTRTSGLRPSTRVAHFLVSASPTSVLVFLQVVRTSAAGWRIVPEPVGLHVGRAVAIQYPSRAVLP